MSWSPGFNNVLTFPFFSRVIRCDGSLSLVQVAQRACELRVYQGCMNIRK